MYKYVIFDLDGTLGDPYEGITNCIKYALASVGIEENDPIRLKSYIGPPLRQTFAKYGFDEDMCEVLTEKYRELFNVSGIHQSVIYPGTEQMLKTLFEHGIKIALASCKPEEACKIILEEYGVLKYFSAVVGATLDKSLDSKPEIIKVALSRLEYKNNPDEHALMVGDRDMDILGAQTNGIDSVGAAYGYGGKDELCTAKADYIINSPTELLPIVLKENIL